MTIPFTKAHGAGNDFLLTWFEQAPPGNLSVAARAICHQHTGIGADGWILVSTSRIHLFNADGSEAEISGNGTRCAAAMLVEAGLAGPGVTLMTGAGEKTLSLIERRGRHFLFDMDMGQPVIDPLKTLPLVSGPCDVFVVNVGNPQCTVFVTEFPGNWIDIGREIEAHPYFPKHTNVSFVRVLDEHTIEARFYERGVGPTASSGTGSTGAAVAAIVSQKAQSPIRIITGSGDLTLRWDDSVYLTGPAEIIGTGEFYF